MTSSVPGQAENDILSCDVSDAALERAAAPGDGQQRITLGICTDWYACGWPLSPTARRAAAGRT